MVAVQVRDEDRADLGDFHVHRAHKLVLRAFPAVDHDARASFSGNDEAGHVPFLGTRSAQK